MIEEIAKVERTTLGWEDHGIFTCFLHLSFGSCSQGAGGYSLDTPVHKDGKFVGRVGTAFGIQWIERVMKACGVDDWSKVKGRTILVLREKPGHIGDDGSNLLGLKPLPTEPGETFIFADLAAEHFPKEDQ